MINNLDASMPTLFLEGLLLQASLIFALGAQNIFVLESGLRRQWPLTISVACFFCDLTLIMLGVLGAGTLFAGFSQLKIFIGAVGVGFLFQYGLLKILVPPEVREEGKNQLGTMTLKRSLFLAFTFSILNPHAYLDAFILIGGYSAKYDGTTERMMVGLGAAVFSLIWFLTLSSAASFMKPLLSDPRHMRKVMVCSGLVLVLLSFRLGNEVYGWATNGPHSSLIVKNISYPMPSSGLFTSILY